MSSQDVLPTGKSADGVPGETAGSASGATAQPLSGAARLRDHVRTIIRKLPGTRAHAHPSRID